MKPKLYIKKFNGFSEKSPLINVIRETPIYRYLLDLGPKGKYIVTSEIPSIRRDNSRFNLIPQQGVVVNPIRVVFRDFVGDSDIRDVIEWPNLMGNNKINATLQRIDPLGLITSQWLLYGCRPTEIISEMFEPLELTLHMDNFTIQF